MPSDPKALGNCPALTELPEPMRRRALDRYQALRPHLEDNLPLTRVAKEASVPFRTAQRWVSRYRRFGLAGLARAGRADRGKPRRLSLQRGGRWVVATLDATNGRCAGNMPIPRGCLTALDATWVKVIQRVPVTTAPESRQPGAPEPQAK